MAKFHGRVGFGDTVEVRPGVFADEIVEHLFYGEVIQNRRILSQDENLNKDLSIGNSISIVGNVYAHNHIFAIKYVEWAGEIWTVTDVEVQFPRLILQLGEVYNGPTTGAPITP
jgi:hypothetical protein